MHSVQIAVRRGGCVVDSVLRRRDGYGGKWGGRREVLISWSNLISMCYGNAIGGIGREWSSLLSWSPNSVKNQLTFQLKQRIGTSFMDSEMTLHSFHFLHPCIPLLSSYTIPLTKGANDTTHPISYSHNASLLNTHHIQFPSIARAQWEQKRERRIAVFCECAGRSGSEIVFITIESALQHGGPEVHYLRYDQ